MVELLRVSPEVTQLAPYLIFSPAIVWWLREAVKSKRPDIEDGEIHHKIPRYRGGKDSEDNLVYLTKVEHAQEHWLLARTARGEKDRRANYWAVDRIVERMEEHEQASFKNWVNEQLRRK